jgi:tryptophan-rich sensory protein
MMIRAVVTALVICAGSAALEGIFAGRGVKHRMGELRLPPYSPPLAGWIGIALLYYGACFVVLYRLLANDHRSVASMLALALIVAIMSINALWNYFFFRKKDVRASFFLSLPYAVLALSLAGLLFRLDTTAAWTFLPYAVYLGYGGWWGYNLWRLNDQRGAA